ncbi:DUF3850 domain-containing protein [Listeria seeligeri]|uniref:DUF3850 domain-containing protein n=1 Tax=Listeria seeligeri TaxID=1640 RepID=UPI0010F15E68|nr:DUF3850 domain-containing protein [Listeria seeligeri]
MIHNLKINSEYFLPVKDDLKKFEIRENDRCFRVGDIVILNEFSPEKNIYSGEKITVKIKYITNYNQKKDFIVFGFAKI